MAIADTTSEEIAKLERAAFVRPEDVNMSPARWVVLQHEREKDLRRMRQEAVRWQ